MHKEGGVYLFYLDVSTRPAPGVPLSRSARPHRSAALIPEHNAAAPFLKCLAPTYRNFKARGKKPAPFRKYGAEKILISTIVCIYLFLTMINEKNAKKNRNPLPKAHCRIIYPSTGGGRRVSGTTPACRSRRALSAGMFGKTAVRVLPIPAFRFQQKIGVRKYFIMEDSRHESETAE